MLWKVTGLIREVKRMQTARERETGELRRILPRKQRVRKTSRPRATRASLMGTLADSVATSSLLRANSTAIQVTINSYELPALLYT